MPPLVVAHNLVKKYGSFEAVSGISFDVMPGECLAVLGPNGAGKSSTMKMLYCASPITAGTLTVDGLDVAKQPRQVKQILGVCPQQDSLDPDLSIRENLLVYARYFDIPASVAKERATRLLDLFQLTEKADVRVETLSGGMQRRLVIARALINDPTLLILDEPTTGLDPQARQLVWAKLRQLRQQGATMILTTHYMEEAARLADRLILMDGGKILAEGKPDDLVLELVGNEVIEIEVKQNFQQPLLDEVHGWDAEIETMEDVVFVFGRNGTLPDPTTPTERFQRRAASLEDVFLRLTGRTLNE